MKPLLLFLLLVPASIVPMTSVPTQAVNPLIGDVSFIAKFGRAPHAGTDETLRIRTHLEYVGKLLESKDVTDLPVELQKKRKRALELLRVYANNERYPGNYDHPGTRRPCFIDRNGEICAVGFLIEKTVGREVAEKINAAHQYDEILEMDNPMVEEWVASSGLTMEECAMIQPAYGTPRENYIEPGYVVSSSVFTGVNFCVAGINGVQISRGSKSKTAAVIGLASGAGQIVLGAIMFPEKEMGFFGQEYTNESKRTLSIVNVGVGSATLILSACNLIANKQTREKLLAWRIYTYPAGRNASGVGIGYTRKF